MAMNVGKPDNCESFDFAVINEAVAAGRKAFDGPNRASRFLLHGFWHAPDMQWAEAVEKLVDRVVNCYAFTSFNSFHDFVAESYAKIIQAKGKSLQELSPDQVQARHDLDIRSEFHNAKWGQRRRKDSQTWKFNSGIPESYRSRLAEHYKLKLRGCNPLVLAAVLVGGLSSAVCNGLHLSKKTIPMSANLTNNDLYNVVDYDTVRAIENDEDLLPLTKTYIAYGNYTWLHPDLSQGSFWDTAVEDRLARRFRELKQLKTKDSVDQAAVINGVAEIHWLLANSAFFSRGSAAIADIVSKILLDSFDINLGNHKQNCGPDFEAFIYRLSDYKKLYTSFFDKGVLPT